MNEEFLKCAETPKASDLNLTIEKISANGESNTSEAFGNEWQNSNHQLWCPFYYPQLWCPIVRFATDGSNYNENIWTPNMLSMPAFQNYTPFNEASDGMNAMYSSLSLGQTHKSLLGNGDQTTSQYWTQTMKRSKEHNVEKIYRYLCRLCDDSVETTDKKEFRTHIDWHLGRKGPFVCKICDKVFPFRSSCRNHLMAHCVVRNRITYSTQCLTETSTDS
jgi:hypothetical protein